MGLKDFDLKTFLFEKGDRIGVATAALVMVLLLVFGIGKVLSGGTASGTATAVRSLGESADRQIMNAPPPVIDESSYKQFVEGTINFYWVDPEPYALKTTFFTPSSMEDNKRRNPEVLVPTESHTAVLHAPVRGYIVNPVGQLMVLKDKSITTQAGMGGMMGGRGGMMGGRGGMPGAGMGGMSGGMGGRGGMPGAGMGGMGGSGDSDTGGGGSGGGFDPFGGLLALKEKKAMETAYVDLDKLASLTNAKPAETVYPYHFAIVSASFPFKQQLQEFRRALRKRNLNELLDLFNSDQAPWQFKGYEVRRRILGPDGKVLEDWDDKFHERLLAATTQLHILSTGIEPPDPKLLKFSGIINQGLVMPRPRLAREMKYPELKLAGIDKTLAEMEEAFKTNRERILTPREKKLKGQGFDPFNPQPPDLMPDPNNQGEGMGGMMGSGGMAGPGGMGGRGMQGSGSMPGPGGPMGGKGGGMGMGGRGLGSGEGGSGMGNMDPYADLPDPVVPEMCLLQFLDPLVTPGYGYEYQLRVKMANPNYKRTDVAFKALARSETLTSRDWSPSIKVYVPSTTEFFVLSDERLERGQEPAGRDRIPVQVHRWIDAAQMTPTNKAQTPVADWVIAERLLFQRGEYLARRADVKVPVWVTNMDSFHLGYNSDSRKRLVPIDFTTKPHPRSPQTPALIVDFEGGRSSEKIGTRSINEQVPYQLLVLLPDGRLVLRSSDRDMANEARKHRVEDRRDWIKKVETGRAIAPGSQGPGSGSMFDTGGGGSPGGGSPGGRGNPDK